MFDEKFCRKSKGTEDYDEPRDDWFLLEYVTARDIKSFITNLLHSEREKERERIVKMCEEMLATETVDQYGEGYDKALSSLRDKLSTV